MGSPSSECFACRPRASRPSRLPRSLCPRHVRACRVETGELLTTVLSWASPEGCPLEGGALAYVYNPVVVDAAGGEALRGWADFGPGVAVFEDRFGARDPVEFRALEDPGMRRLWRTVAAHGTAFPPATWRTKLRRLIGRPPPDPVDLERLFLLHRLLCLHRNVQAHRAAAGVPWPRSFAELERWLSVPFEEDEEPPFATLVELDAVAVALASRACA